MYGTMMRIGLVVPGLVEGTAVVNETVEELVLMVVGVVVGAGLGLLGFRVTASADLAIPLPARLIAAIATITTDLRLRSIPMGDPGRNFPGFNVSGSNVSGFNVPEFNEVHVVEVKLVDFAVCVRIAFSYLSRSIRDMFNVRIECCKTLTFKIEPRIPLLFGDIIAGQLSQRDKTRRR
jgi:hypothetical protein